MGVNLKASLFFYPRLPHPGSCGIAAASSMSSTSMLCDYSKDSPYTARQSGFVLTKSLAWKQARAQGGSIGLHPGQPCDRRPRPMRRVIRRALTVRCFKREGEPRDIEDSGFFDQGHGLHHRLGYLRRRRTHVA